MKKDVFAVKYCLQQDARDPSALKMLNRENARLKSLEQKLKGLLQQIHDAYVRQNEISNKNGLGGAASFSDIVDRAMKSIHR